MDDTCLVPSRRVPHRLLRARAPDAS